MESREKNLLLQIALAVRRLPGANPYDFIGQRKSEFDIAIDDFSGSQTRAAGWPSPPEPSVEEDRGSLQFRAGWYAAMRHKSG
jgi:hypothetical protein